MAANYTSGPIGSTMIRAAFSMVAGTLAVCGYNLADTYFVSILGKQPLAAMGYTFPVIMLVGCLYHGLSSGLMTPVAQLLGSSRKKTAARQVSAGIMFILLISIVIAIIGCYSIDYVFIKFGATTDILPLIRDYMIIWYIGSFTGALAGTANSLLIASGAAKSAGFLMMGGMLTNVALDALLVFGFGPIPALGIAGASLATILSQACSATVGLLLLHKKEQMIGSFKIPFTIIIKCWKTTMRYAIPAMLGMLLMPIGSAVVTKAVAACGGDNAVAAAAAAGRVEMAAFVFPMSLGITLMPMIAQNYGAKLFDRIRNCHKFSMNFAFIFLMVMAVIYFIAAPWIASWFSNDKEIKELIVIYLRIVPWGFAGIEVHRYGTFFYTATGHPNTAAILNGIRVLGFLVPFTLLAAYFNSVIGIFFARFVADFLAGILAFVLSRQLVKKLYKKQEKAKANIN